MPNFIEIVRTLRKYRVLKVFSKWSSPAILDFRRPVVEIFTEFTETTTVLKRYRLPPRGHPGRDRLVSTLSQLRRGRYPTFRRRPLTSAH